MSEKDQARKPEEEEAPVDSKEGDAMAALLKRSLGERALPAEPPPDLLRGVQKKIRTRSRGKFYGDGWSTAQTKVSYALVALVMLVLVGVVYFVLGPMGFSK
jgi:hypothetical protein